jgi:hypothetical protein
MNARLGPARTRARRLTVLALLLVAASAGCNGGSDDAPPGTPLTAPQGPEITVDAGKAISVRVSAKGAESYEWKLEGRGRISANAGEAVLFNSPEEEGTARLIVRARNKHGVSPEAALTINILAQTSIRLDTLAIPAGWMSGAGRPEQFMSLGVSRDGCPSQQGCIQVTYKPGGSWGGIFWWPHQCGPSGRPEAWEMARSGACGINVLQKGGFKAVSRLSFTARGEKGGEVVEFKVGSDDLSPKPGKSSGKVRLTPEWKPYGVDLKGLDFNNAVALFAWTAADQSNPQGVVFYLDDIRIEGVK